MRNICPSTCILYINLSSYRIQLVRFCFFLTILFLFYFVQEIVLLHTYNHLLLFLSSLTLSLGFSIIFFKFNRRYINFIRTLILFGVLLNTVFFNLTYGVEVGFYLYYFFNLLSIPYLVSFKTEQKTFNTFIVFSLLFYGLSFYSADFNNFGIQQIDLTDSIKSDIFKTNIILNFALCFYFIMTLINTQSQMDYIDLKRRSKRKVIDKLLEKNKQIKESDLWELKHLISERNLFFMSKFDKTFPDFIEKLGILNQSDKEICALTRLSMDTKDIARFYNCSIKSIENRKYRIRKKMNVENGVRFEKFINDL